MQHRATYCNDVVPNSLSSLVVGSSSGGGALPILIDTPNNVVKARSHALSLARSRLSFAREDTRDVTFMYFASWIRRSRCTPTILNVDRLRGQIASFTDITKSLNHTLTLASKSASSWTLASLLINWSRARTEVSATRRANGDACNDNRRRLANFQAHQTKLVSVYKTPCVDRHCRQALDQLFYSFYIIYACRNIKMYKRISYHKSINKSKVICRKMY